MSFLASSQAFLAVRDLSQPDGRPLYAYRCNSEELAEIEEHLREILSGNPGASRVSVSTAQLFCLWAAEWWRRNHDGGTWRWEEMLAAVGARHYSPGYPGYLQLLRIVSGGLAAWKRELLWSGHGRAFLVTLGCEGGLPLKLITRDGDRLRLYFKALLEEMRVYAGSVTAQDLAERVQHRLPARLRQEVVFELSARLIAIIWRLQQEIGDSPTPVRDLDQRRPGWRGELPLDLDDTVAHALLNNLLLDAASIAKCRGQGIRLIRNLVRQGARWEVVGEWQLPSALEEPELVDLFSISSMGMLPQRFDIGVRQETEPSRSLVFATKRPRSGLTTAIELEHSRYGGKPIAGEAVASGRFLVLRVGDTEHTSDGFRGADALGESVWVFAGPAAEREAGVGFVADRSCRVRFEECFVATPADAQPIVTQGASCEPVGRLEFFSRTVYRVSGRVDFAYPDGTRAVVTTGHAEDDAEVERRLVGPMDQIGRDGTRVYRGPPQLMERCGSGAWLAIQPRELSWRSDSPGAAWQPYDHTAVGDGKLRMVRNGEIRYFVRLRILPYGTRFHFLPDTDPHRGEVRISGSGAERVELLGAAGVSSTSRQQGDELSVSLSANGPSPTDLDFELAWPARGRMRIRLPFPSRRAAFELPGGDTLVTGASIAVGRLSGTKAVAILPRSGCQLCVEGDLRGGRTDAGGRMIRAEMSELAPGLFEYDLGRLQREVETRLNACGDADAYVRFRIQSNDVGNLDSAILNVTRFDLSLDTTDPQVIRLSEDTLRHVRPGDAESLRLEAVPLLDTDGDPQDLARTGSASWEVPPEALAKRPLLITGWQGDWCRIRPVVLCSVGDAHPSAEPAVSIASYYADTSSFRRKDLLLQIIAGLAHDPTHEDWSVVDRMIQWSQHLSPVTFDILKRIAEDDEAAAVAALRVSEAHFPAFWRELESLPFWWRLVSRRSWEAAVDAYATAIKTQVESLGDLGEILRPSDLARDRLNRAICRVSGELPCLEPVLRLALSRSLGESVPDGVSLVMQPVYREQWLAQVRKLASESPVLGMEFSTIPVIDRLDGLLRLTGATEEGRELIFPRTGRWLSEQRASFVNAPVLAAVSALTSKRLDAPQVRAIRRTHELAPTWFSEMYGAAYLYGIGARHHATLASA